MFVHLPEKSLILLSVTVCGFFLCTVSASDIVSDTQQEEPDAVWDVTLPEQEERSIENNTAFYAVLNELSRTRSFTDAQIKKLFEVLDKTPDSPFLAANLLSELRLNNTAGLLTEQFSALAQKHPSRFMLTAIAADLLQMQKRNQDAIALLRKAADYLMAAENRDELLHRKPNYAEYILLKLAILLAMEKDYESSEKLIQRIASWKNFKDNLFLKQLSLINYAAMRKTASDSRFLWIFPSEKEKMREKFDRTAEEYLKELAAIQEKGKNVDLRKNNAALSLLALEKHSGTDSVILGNLLNNPADASSMLSLAEHYMRQKEPALAARVWKQIFRMTQNQPLWFYLAYGNALAAAGMTGEAVSLYELALLMAPADNNLKLRIGQLLYSEGKYQEALNAVRELPIPTARYLAALCCHFLGKPEESLKFFKAFFESPQDTGGSAPDYMPFLYAENAEKAKKYRLAEQIARDCLKKNPDSPDALNYLGYTFAERNTNLEEAEKLIRRALKLKPENRDYQDSMAWLLYRRKQYKEALEWIEKAMSSEPEKAFSATVYDHAGDIYYALGDRKNAVRCWKEAVTNYSPEPVDISKILKKIKDAGGKW